MNMARPTFAEVLAAAPAPDFAEMMAWRAQYEKDFPRPESDRRPEVVAALVAANRAALIARGVSFVGRPVQETMQRLCMTNAERAWAKAMQSAMADWVRDVHKPRWALRVLALVEE